MVRAKSFCVRLESMKTKDLEVQISLLSDPDDRIYSLIHDQLVAKGASMVPILETSWEKSSNPIINERIETIIHHINFQQILNEVEIWTQTKQQDLVKLLLLISKVFYPNLNERKVKFGYQKLKNEIWLELSQHLTGLEKMRILNHLVFNMNDFRSVHPKQTGVKDYLFSEMINQKKGNDFSLSLLYLSLAVDLELPLYGVDLPGNMILAYLDADGHYISNPQETKPLFYVNPANRGVIFGVQDIEKYLKAQGLPEDPFFFKPLPLRKMVQRYLEVLKVELEKTNDSEKISEIEILSEMLS